MPANKGRDTGLKTSFSRAWIRKVGRGIKYPEQRGKKNCEAQGISCWCESAEKQKKMAKVQFAFHIINAWAQFVIPLRRCWESWFKLKGRCITLALLIYPSVFPFFSPAYYMIKSEKCISNYYVQCGRLIKVPIPLPRWPVVRCTEANNWRRRIWCRGNCIIVEPVWNRLQTMTENGLALMLMLMVDHFHVPLNTLIISTATVVIIREWKWCLMERFRRRKNLEGLRCAASRQPASQPYDGSMSTYCRSEMISSVEGSFHLPVNHRR